MGKCNPITIRGTTYPSRTAAADALGLSVSAISSAAINGTLDVVGTYAETNGHKLATATMPVVIRGKRYPSIKAAAKALGISRHSISTLLARDRIDQAGKGRGNHGKQRPPIAAIPIKIGPTTYPSTRAAAKALGIPLCRIKKLRKKMKAAGADPLLITKQEPTK
jgi:hypothetical protein